MATTINGNDIIVPGKATIAALILPIIIKAIDYLALATDEVVIITANAVRVTLPTAVGVAGKRYTVKLSGASLGYVETTSAQTIDGASEYVLSENFQHLTVVSDGANWLIIEGWLPTPGYSNLY